MAHKEQRDFCEMVKQKHPSFFINKKVLDIGSLNINGQNRDLFQNCNYIGLDVGEGDNVDIISVGHLYEGPDNYFDTIISTEVFEHDMYYAQTITNIMRMLKPGGLFLFTCAAPGRSEHGTRRLEGYCAPLLLQISEEWADYYKNLEKKDIELIPNFKETFPDAYFELKETDIEFPSDLYFYGIKGGEKYLTDHIIPEFPKLRFGDSIFVVDYWIDTQKKEDTLIKLIKKLKIFNIPILLTGHHPLKIEIQKMVDYYLYDKNNPILTNDEFEEYGVASGRWSEIGDFHIDNHFEFHHDYAIWETMRNAFNFCKFLGKKYIHFLEYDNLPDLVQYRQSFLENALKYNVVLYEYNKSSIIDKHLSEYCATFIFSIDTDIALNTVNMIKSKMEYFSNRPKGWQLERVFLDCVRKQTNSIRLSEYIPNKDELNIHAAWNRDGINMNGAFFQVYLVADDEDNLLLHLISGFHEKPANKDYLIEVNYDEYKKFRMLYKGEYLIEKIGKYKKGDRVKVYYHGVEVFNEFLKYDVADFRKLNRITKKEEEKKPKNINLHFLDGPFIEILENENNLYHVEFINGQNNTVIYELDLKSNHWAKCSKTYYIDWIIRVSGIDNDFHLEYIFDPKDKRFLVSFESKSVGDNIAWIGQIENFRIHNKCEVICSTFHNYLFIDQYPNIKFVEPGSVVDNLYGSYRIGFFNKENNYDSNKHISDPKKEPLMKVASDILGMEYQEVKTKLPIFNIKKKKMVSIAVHSTSQCKYWNNPTGWQDVVDFLNDKGYEVRLLSKENDGYMGNMNPKGVTLQPVDTLLTTLNTIQESELFVGISSGLSWLSWGSGTPTIIISGFTDRDLEPINGVNRIINKNVCNSCWRDHILDAGDWNWCPINKNTSRQFECSKTITSDEVISEIKRILNITE